MTRIWMPVAAVNEIGRFLRGGVAAAPRVHVERARLCLCALADQERTKRRGGRAAAGLVQQTPARESEGPIAHALSCHVISPIAGAGGTAGRVGHVRSGFWKPR
jgi:hypothetical protein